MTSRTFAIAFTIASLTGLAAAVPAQAATRAVDIHAGLFATRCIDQGGIITNANPTFACQTPETTIVCSFMTLNRAHCEWPGIEGQVAVNRIIGMQNAQAQNGSSNPSMLGGGNGGGGGIDQLDLPIDNGGGGGIDVPDLPINNG